MPKGIPGRKHGTASMYTGGCRCEPCTEAMTEYHKQWRHRTGRARPRDEYLASLPHPQHGTESGYTSLGCRCDECKAASAKARRQRNAKDPDLARKRWRESRRRRRAATSDADASLSSRRTTA